MVVSDDVAKLIPRVLEEVQFTYLNYYESSVFIPRLQNRVKNLNPRGQTQPLAIFLRRGLSHTNQENSQLYLSLTHSTVNHMSDQ
jgi:hypothetical protein